MVVAMLFIGIGMVASLRDYHWLLTIHRPLGIMGGKELRWLKNSP